MKKLFLKKVFLSILIVSILSIGLTGCLDITVPPSETETGTVKLVVSGDYYYDLTMDGVTRFSNKQPGTYTLTNVPIGNHSFEAIDVDGVSYGYDSVTQYISTGTNYVYLEPQSTPTTGTVYIVLSGDETYNLKMDGMTYFSSKPAATYTLTNVPIGNHTFEAIDVWGSSWGYDSETKYISAGSNYVYLSP
jgi:hypothetical protein